MTYLNGCLLTPFDMTEMKNMLGIIKSILLFVECYTFPQTVNEM
jgi:hypothetical protein